jgi:tagatose 6-phosphate kinase
MEPDMITTVTLNASVDKRYAIRGFAAGGVFRSANASSTPGGKGLNVARVIHALGRRVTATGFAGGANGAWIEERLDALGLAHAFVPVDGESRLP